MGISLRCNKALQLRVSFNVIVLLYYANYCSRFPFFAPTGFNLIGFLLPLRLFARAQAFRYGFLLAFIAA